MSDNFKYGYGKLRPQTFSEFDKKAKDRIAALIDFKKDELILSRAVEDYVYASTRALDVGDYFNTAKKSGAWEHAINKNADYFDVTEIEEQHPDKKIERYLTFRTAAMFKNHESDKIENAIGLVFDSIFIKDPYEDMHVTALFGIDKMKAANIARDLIKYPTRVPVSMGCSITHSICTACAKVIPSEMQICECLKYHRGQRVKNKRVAEFLKGVDFFELSVVSNPAASKAYVIDAVSELIPGRLIKVASETPEGFSTLEIMANVYNMIKGAKTVEEKNRLSLSLDRVIYNLQKKI